MSDRSPGAAKLAGLRRVGAPTAAVVATVASRLGARLWLAVILFGAAAIAFYFTPFFDADSRAIAYIAIEATAVVVVFASILVRRPARALAWALFGLGMLSVMLGDIVWLWLVQVEQVEPTTSLADVFYLAEYPLLIAGVLLLVRGRPDRASILDTLIVTTAAFMVVLELIVQPSLDGYSGSTLDLVVMLIYPIADVALLAVALRSLLVGDLHSRSLSLLLSGVVAVVVADVLNLRINLTGVGLDPSPLDAFWLASMVMWTAAVMHPTARAQFANIGSDWMNQRTARRLLLAAALVIPPAALAIGAASGTTSSTSISLVSWGVIAVLVMMRTDVAMSLARQSEDALRSATERLSLAARAGSVGTWDYDPLDNKLVWDDQMFSLYGIDRDRFDGTYEAWLGRLHTEDRRRVDKEMRQALRGEREFDTEFRVVWPDGAVHDIRAISLVQRGPLGTALSAVGTSWDITDQKQSQRDLQDTNAQLANAMTRAIELAAEADTANSAKSDFLANMSHEIRTPLNGVIGMTGLLLDTKLDPEQRRYAETVRSSGESLLALLNDILDFSKIEAGKLTLETIDFDLRVLLESFASLVAMRAQDAGLEFICAAGPDVPVKLSGDPGRLRQILLNLAGNAVKFTHTGEVSVRTTVESESEEDVLLRFSVKDTGIGIPAAKQGLLFQKFSQADSSTTRQYGGTGLGLAISKQLAEMMGGEIGLISEQGCGSEFWFTARFAKQAVQTETAAPSDIRGIRILVVDDNATNRDVLAAQMEAWGVRLAAVADGLSAIQELRRAKGVGDPYAAAIIDMEMPGTDGADLATIIKTDENLSSTLLVLMTSIGARGDAEDMKAVGIAATLVKPVRQSDLFDCLATILAASAPPEPQARVARPTPLRRELSDARRATARILLAEDNITNQQVALGILRKLGMRADAVADGTEAIRSLETIPYDLVLMDMQMPEMDGLEATHCVRDPESAVLNHEIPIIAMTANALQGDRERCLEAGMDGYITKPVSPIALTEVLETWLPHDGEAEAGSEAGSEAEPAGEPSAGEQPPAVQDAEIPVFDHDGLVARMMGDEGLAQIIVGEFLEDIPKQIDTLKTYITAGDIAGATRQAHSIKGASANVGGESLRAVAFDAEKAGHEGNLRGIISRVPDIEFQFVRLSEAMGDFADPASPESGDPT